jgi:hypothetical protein
LTIYQGYSIQVSTIAKQSRYIYVDARADIISRRLVPIAMSSSFGMEFFLTPLLTTYLLLLKYETIRRTANASIYEVHATIT